MKRNNPSSLREWLQGVDPIKRAWRIESRRKQLHYASCCFFCREVDIFCLELDHPVTEKLDEFFERANCRNCHRKQEIRRDTKRLTHNGQHNVVESGLEQLQRYLQLHAEDLDYVAEHLERSPNFPIQQIVMDCNARAASFRRVAKVIELTLQTSSPTISKKMPGAVLSSDSTADAEHPTVKAPRERKQQS